MPAITRRASGPQPPGNTADPASTNGGGYDAWFDSCMPNATIKGEWDVALEEFATAIRGPQGNGGTIFLLRLRTMCAFYRNAALNLPGGPRAWRAEWSFRCCLRLMGSPPLSAGDQTPSDVVINRRNAKWTTFFHPDKFPGMIALLDCDTDMARATVGLARYIAHIGWDVARRAATLAANAGTPNDAPTEALYLSVEAMLDGAAEWAYQRRQEVSGLGAGESEQLDALVRVVVQRQVRRGVIWAREGAPPRQPTIPPTVLHLKRNTGSLPEDEDISTRENPHASAPRPNPPMRRSQGGSRGRGSQRQSWGSPIDPTFSWLYVAVIWKALSTVQQAFAEAITNARRQVGNELFDEVVAALRVDLQRRDIGEADMGCGIGEHIATELQEKLLLRPDGEPRLFDMLQCERGESSLDPDLIKRLQLEALRAQESARQQSGGGRQRSSGRGPGRQQPPSGGNRTLDEERNDMRSNTSTRANAGQREDEGDDPHRPIDPIYPEVAGPGGDLGYMAIARVPADSALVARFTYRRNIPLDLRDVWAAIITRMFERWEEARTPEEQDIALLWIANSNVIFFRSTRGGVRGEGQFRRRFDRFRKGEFDKLIEDLKKDLANARPRDRREEDDDAVIARVLKLVRKGELGQARRLLSSNGIADMDDANVWAAMKAQIGQSYKGDVPTHEDLGLGNARIEKLHMEGVLRKSRNMKAFSPTGGCNEQYKFLAMYTSPAALAARSKINTFMTAFLNADMPPWFTQTLDARKVLPLLKQPVGSSEVPPGGTPPVRPIAIGHPLVQMACAALTERHKEQMELFFGGNQLSVGLKDAAGLQANATRLVLEKVDGVALVKVDVEAMFPSMATGVMLERMAEVAPTELQELTIAMATLQSGPHKVSCNGMVDTRLMGEGLAMGNQLSSFAAACVTLPIIKAMQARARELDENDVAQVRACMDDFMIVATPETCVQVIEEILDPELAKLGLKRKPSKNECYAKPGVDISALEGAGIPRASVIDETGMTHNGICIMGVPLGSSGYISATLDVVADKIESSIKDITKLHQVSLYATYALANATINRRATHFARYCRPMESAHMLRRLDACFSALLELCLGQPFDDTVGLVESFFLPVSNNGSGAVLYSDLTDIAYAGAFLDIVPRLFNTSSHGYVSQGYLQSASLSTLLAPENAMANGNTEARNTAMIDGTEMGADFKAAYVRLQQQVGPVEHEDILSATPEDVGDGVNRAQSHLSKSVYKAMAARVEDTMAARSLDDPLATAYFARKDSASANGFLTGWPGRCPGSDLPNELFRIIFQRLFGLPLTCLTQVHNASFVNNRGNQAQNVDRYGRSLTGAKLPGDTDRFRHDKMKILVHQVVTVSGCGSQVEPVHVFGDLMSAETHLAEQRLNTRVGIIPDLLLRVTAGDDEIGEIKGCGNCVSNMSRPSRDRTATQYAVTRRERDVKTEYIRKANAIDRRQGHGDPATRGDPPQSEWGPVRTRLNEYKVLGLAFGAHGELSPDLVALTKRCASAAASRRRHELPIGGLRSLEGLIRWQYSCRLGMAAQRAHAEHLRDRIAIALPGCAQNRATNPAASVDAFGRGGLPGVLENFRNTMFTNATSLAWTEDAPGGCGDGFA